MGPGIVIPLVVLAVVVPVVLAWAKSNLKRSRDERDDDPVSAPSARLTSNVLRELPVPPWRVVYEIADDRLDGIQHVLIGPPGIFALRTTLDPVPPPPTGDPDPHDVARAAIARAGLDDALRRCAMASDRLIQVHWGTGDERRPAVVELLPGMTAVDGRSLTEWATSLDATALTPAQVDLAWQTVVVAIGRPDPLL